MSITIRTGISGDEQMAEENATLQGGGDGDGLEFSIAVYVRASHELPAHDEDALADYLRSKLAPIADDPSITIWIEIGPGY
jgi:hypothetical protein